MMANEKRLIDANELCKFFQERYEFLRSASQIRLPGGFVRVDAEIEGGAIIAKEFLDKVKQAPTVDAVEVVHSHWEWFEEWSPSTPENPRECDDCGWRCGRCKAALADMVGGYWDDYYEEPKLNHCPNCGAKMDGDGNG